MIQLATQKYQDFIDWLNRLQYTKEPCQIVVLPDYDCVRGNKEDEIGFACYHPDTKVMYVAGLIPDIPELESDYDIKLFMVTNITHEYIHHIQNVEGRDFDEDEAVTKAKNIAEVYCILWKDE